jgi:hypothetical protein
MYPSFFLLLEDKKEIRTLTEVKTVVIIHDTFQYFLSETQKSGSYGTGYFIFEGRNRDSYLNKMLPLISKDLLFIIRDYLIGFTFGEYEDDFHTFIRQESARSWRNFLSVSNGTAWRNIRKETMIWSLNPMVSRKYFLDTYFRIYIDDSMMYPARQLECRLEEDVKFTPSLLDAIRMTELRSLFVGDFLLTEFPVMVNLKSLCLRNCLSMNNLGSFLS